VYSQIAEILTNHFHQPKIRAFSAGYTTGEAVNPYVQKILEPYKDSSPFFGIKSLQDIPKITFEYVITINALEFYPDVKFLRKLEWRISSNEENSLEDIEHIAQQISTKVQSFIVNIAA